MGLDLFAPGSKANLLMARTLADVEGNETESNGFADFVQIFSRPIVYVHTKISCVDKNKGRNGKQWTHGRKPPPRIMVHRLERS